MINKTTINFSISFEPNFWNEENLRGWIVPFNFSPDQLSQLHAALDMAENDPELSIGCGIRSANEKIRQAFPDLFSFCDERARLAMVGICLEICPGPLPEIYWYVDYTDIHPEVLECDDELETVITGEGNVRHLKYYVTDHLFVQHWLIRNGLLSVLYSEADISGEYTNEYTNISVAPLLQHFNCLETELIDHIMSYCKRMDNQICLEVFLELLKQLGINYNVKSL